jgi:TonB family protein
MDRGRKNNGITLLTAILINVIIFSLAFVYMVDREKPSPAILPGGTDPPVEGEVSTAHAAEVLELLPPAEFIDESGADISDDFDFPQFKNIFNSYLLPGNYRGKEYLVTVKLNIDPSGKLASEPRVVVSSGEKDVDDETVRRLQRVSYRPAKNISTGEPIGAEVTAQIFWLPGSG